MNKTKNEDETAERVKKKGVRGRGRLDAGVAGERAGEIGERRGREEVGVARQGGIENGAGSGEAVENQRTATPHRDGRGSQSSAHLRSARVSCSVGNRLRQGV